MHLNFGYIFNNSQLCPLMYQYWHISVWNITKINQSSFHASCCQQTANDEARESYCSYCKVKYSSCSMILWIKNDGVGGRVYSFDRCNFLWAQSLFTLHNSALFSPSRLSLGTALVHRDVITKNTSVCRLICAANLCPYSITNKGELWALQRTM